jgi:hypothetical protein
MNDLLEVNNSNINSILYSPHKYFISIIMFILKHISLKFHNILCLNDN